MIEYSMNGYAFILLSLGFMVFVYLIGGFGMFLEWLDKRKKK